MGKSMITRRNRASAALTTGRARSAAIADPICAAILAHHRLVAERLPIEVIERCDELLIDVVFNTQGEAAMKRAAMDLPRRFAEVVFSSRSHGGETDRSVTTAPQRGRLRYDPAPAAEARA
jgi:hypothetical protein